MIKKFMQKTIESYDKPVSYGQEDDDTIHRLIGKAVASKMKLKS